MKRLAAREPTAPPRKIRNTTEWFERIKLVTATARSCAAELAREYETPEIRRRRNLLQQRRLAGLRTKFLVCG